MEQRRLDRIRLLSARFHELQGLRMALLGACLALFVGGYLAAAPKATDRGVTVAVLVSLVPAWIGIHRLDRFYATTFGRQVSESRRKLRLIAGSQVLVLQVVGWLLSSRIPENLASGTVVIAAVALGSLWVAARDWPWRTYYLLAPAAVAISFPVGVSAGVAFSPNLMGTALLLLGAAMVPIGLLDHLLLVRLMEEARSSETTRAARPAHL